MSEFRAQIFGNVAVATFYLVGTEIRDDKVRDITNRVTAFWVKSDGEWKEAHHHESPLLGGGVETGKESRQGRGRKPAAAMADRS